MQISKMFEIKPDRTSGGGHLLLLSWATLGHQEPGNSRAQRPAEEDAQAPETLSREDISA